jgi:hypothetical protein
MGLGQMRLALLKLKPQCAHRLNLA